MYVFTYLILAFGYMILSSMYMPFSLFCVYWNFDKDRK